MGELTTDRQRQFLVDLGANVPHFKEDASRKIEDLVGVFNRWISNSFSKSSAMERQQQRQIQIALNAGGWSDMLPKVPKAWTDDQRLQFLAAVKDAVGMEAFLALGPKGITKFADALGVADKQRKPKVVKFSCECGQDYEAPEEMAGTSLACQACSSQIVIARPARGFYAAPTESQLLQAELYEIPVDAATHRGALKAEIAAIQSDPARRPSWQVYQERYRRQRQRRLALFDQEVARLESDLATQTDTTQVNVLHEKIREAKASGAALRDEIEMERLSKEEDAEENAREVGQFRREYYEPRFNADDDWGEFYRKPTRAQFDAVYNWLDQNRPGWDAVSDITNTIDRLFPELRR